MQYSDCAPRQSSNLIIIFPLSQIHPRGPRTQSTATSFQSHLSIYIYIYIHTHTHTHTHTHIHIHTHAYIHTNKSKNLLSDNFCMHVHTDILHGCAACRSSSSSCLFSAPRTQSSILPSKQLPTDVCTMFLPSAIC